ncbi:MAG: hypothetical protein WHV60_08960, partial [Bacteroidota bacterium]
YGSTTPVFLVDKEGDLTANTAAFNGNVTIDNTASNTALSITNGGGDVKLSYASYTVSGNAVTIGNDVSVAYITSDNDGNPDELTMPTSASDGKFLYVVVYDPTSNNDDVELPISTPSTTITRSAAYMGITLVFANGGWRIVGVYQHN